MQIEMPRISSPTWQQSVTKTDSLIVLQLQVDLDVTSHTHRGRRIGFLLMYIFSKPKSASVSR